MSSIAEKADIFFKFKKVVPPNGLFNNYFLIRNKGFAYRKGWRFLWEIIEIGFLSFSLVPTSLSALWVVPLSILLVSHFVDILFHCERFLLTKGYASLRFSKSIVWLLLCQLGAFYLLKDELINTIENHPWVSWFLLFKGSSIVIKQILSLWTLPYSTRLRPYFSQMVYPMTMVICSLISIGTYSVLSGGRAFAAILLIWSVGGLVPELMFLKKVFEIKKMKWFNSKVIGKRITLKIFSQGTIGWFVLGVIPYFIVKEIFQEKTNYSPSYFLGTVCLFFIIQRWVLRPWRSFQLDALKWKKRLLLTQKRKKEIRKISFVITCLSLLLIALPWFRFIQLRSPLVYQMLFEITSYVLLCFLYIEAQTLELNFSKKEKWLIAIMIGSYGIQFMARELLVVIRLLLAFNLFYLSQKKIKPTFLIPNSGEKVLKIRPKFKNRILEIGSYLNRSELIIPLEDKNMISKYLRFDEIDDIHEVQVPEAIDFKEYAYSLKVVRASDKAVQEKVLANSRTDRIILAGFVGHLGYYPLVRLIKNNKEIYVIILNNSEEILNKMRQSWFLLK